jgi:hypothetical protein
MIFPETVVAIDTFCIKLSLMELYIHHLALPSIAHAFVSDSIKNWDHYRV